MMRRATKRSTKTIAHGKSCISHILFVTVLSLLKSAIRVKGQGAVVVEKGYYLYYKSVIFKP